MPIHELYFNDQGKIVQTVCVDDRIKSAQADAQKSGHDQFPQIAQSLHMQSSWGEPTVPRPPSIVRKLKAISPTQVIAEEFVLGHLENGDYRIMPIARAVWTEEEINRANLRIGDRGFGYSETDVYVAPKLSESKT